MEKWGTAARDVVALDLETTGLDSKTERILEIGAVRIRDGREEASFSRLINPGRGDPGCGPGADGDHRGDDGRLPACGGGAAGVLWNSAGSSPFWGTTSCSTTGS